MLGKISRRNIYCIVLQLLSAIVSAPHSPVTIKATTFLDSRHERGIENLIPCENKGNRAHVVNKNSYCYNYPSQNSSH